MWLTQDIEYKKVKIFKKTKWGRREKWGYELLRPISFEYKGEILTLEAGYVWDGPSFPKFLSFLIGNIATPSLLAASALHDAVREPSAEDNELKGGNTFFYTIPKAATMYREAIRAWPEREVEDWQAQTQYIGLLIFHPVQTFFAGNHKWKKIVDTD